MLLFINWISISISTIWDFTFFVRKMPLKLEGWKESKYQSGGEKNEQWDIKKIVYMSTISFLSKDPSNSSNSSFHSTLAFITSTKLLGKEPTLKSFCQFLLMKMSLSRLFVCTWHLLKFVKISTKENILSISIWDSTMPKIWWARKANIGNIDHV